MPVTTTILVTIGLALSIGTNNNAELNRTQVLNIHSKLDDTWRDWEAKLAGVGHWNTSFGRSIGRLDWVARNVPANTTDPFRCNTTKLMEFCSKNPQTDAALAHYFPKPGQLNYIESTNAQDWYTTWKYGFNTYGNGSTAGLFYADYLKYCTQLFEGKIVEVMNEPNIHLEEMNATWTDVIQFHIDTAQEIHSRFGSTVRVAGPTSAYNAFQAGKVPFDDFNTYMGPFIDQAGSSMDLFSLHLYDGFDGWTEEWKGRRIGTNIQATLDLLESQSLHRLGYVKPYEVSEFGSTFADWKTPRKGHQHSLPWSDRHVWAFLIAANGKVIEFMDRSDRIVKANPFIVHRGAFWKIGRYPFQLFDYQPHNHSQPLTAYGLFYDFWRDVTGVRVPLTTLPGASDAQTNLQSIGFISTTLDSNHNGLIVILNNLADDASSVNLCGIFSTLNVTEAKHISLHWSEEAKSPKLTEKKFAVYNCSEVVLLPSSINKFVWLGTAEAPIVVPQRKIVRRTYYIEPGSPAVFQPLAREMNFSFAVPTKECANFDSFDVRICAAMPCAEKNFTGPPSSVNPTLVMNGDGWSTNPQRPGYADPVRGMCHLCFNFENAAGVQANSGSSQQLSFRWPKEALHGGYYASTAVAVNCHPPAL